MRQVALVLKSKNKEGGDTGWKVEYAEDLWYQLVDAKYDPKNMYIYSDTEISFTRNVIQLEHPNWENWWCKMEIFDTSRLPGNILYFDLDTMILNSVWGMGRYMDTHDRMPIMLSDFYNEKSPASGAMYMPKRVREQLWNTFIKNPEACMEKYKSGGDQSFIADTLIANKWKITRWQDLFPGKFISYKKHIACKGMAGYSPSQSIGDGTLPTKASILCFHGKQKPWNTDLSFLYNTENKN